MEKRFSFLFVLQLAAIFLEGCHSGRTPIRTADQLTIAIGNLEKELVADNEDYIVEEILSKEVCEETVYLTSVFHWAVEENMPKIVLKCLALGVDVDEPDDNFGYNVLQKSIIGRKIDLTRLLLSFSANPNLTSPEGYTPLHLCIKHEFYEAIPFILESGGDPRNCGNTQFTPMQYAERRKDNVAVGLLQTYLMEGSDSSECHVEASQS